MNDVFDNIRERISIIEVIERCGLQIERGNKLKCFAHEDQHASVKVYPDHIYCFVCNKAWDAVGLVGELFELTPIEAAQKLDKDFGLNLFTDKPLNKKERRKAALLRKQRDADRAFIESFESWAERASNTIAAYLRLLDQWKRDYAPKTPDEDDHPFFVEACQNLDLWNYLYMETFVDGGFKERVWLYREYKGGIEAIARRIDAVRKKEIA